MSIDLTIDQNLSNAAQFVKDQNGNSSSLSLTRDGTVGIGTISPNQGHKLDVKGSIRVESPNLGEGLSFAGSDFSLGAVQDGFRLQKGGWRIFEVYGTNDLSIDNVNVYPDNDVLQLLGKETNRWKEVNAAAIKCESIEIRNLETPPPGITTVELVMDVKTGKIYRKA